MKKIVIDTDPGIDDTMAILMALASRDLDVLALTTTFGNAAVETTTRNALLITEKFAPELPVARGAAVPLALPAGRYPDFVHGNDGLGNIDPDDSLKVEAPESAAELIVKLVMAHPGEVTLVALGPLTNLATALQLAPDISNKVAGVVTMGGALGIDGFSGNVSPVAEANYFGDPHAADLVFSAPWPVTMVGLDVTMKTRMPPAMLTEIEANGGAAGRFIAKVSAFYREFYEALEARPDFPVHDSSAIACVVAPHLYQFEKAPLRIATEGICRGMTIQVSRPEQYPENFWTHAPAQSVCIDCEEERVLELIRETLCHPLR